jgi:hypothetical protein
LGPGPSLSYDYPQITPHHTPRAAERLYKSHTHASSARRSLCFDGVRDPTHDPATAVLVNEATMHRPSHQPAGEVGLSWRLLQGTKSSACKRWQRGYECHTINVLQPAHGYGALFPAPV